MTPRFLVPRFHQATTDLGENKVLWQALLDQSDNFAYQTANEGKGGPFGAQLWLVQEESKQFLLVGNEDSNAVVSKGLANAHAEAENLSPANRQSVINFLREHQGEGWKVVQVSSAESCQSCRSKQVLFARELIDQGLIEAGDFRVLFKATYDQTREIAGFNDAPFDTTFRYIAEKGILGMSGGLLNLKSAIEKDDAAAIAVEKGQLVYVPIHEGTIPDGKARLLFEKFQDIPFCVITDNEGKVLSFATDTREMDSDLNEIEKTPIVAALHTAAQNKRAEGHFESWNLNGAKIYTNCADIGPLSYAETLWYNIDSIVHVKNMQSCDFQEVPNYANKNIFDVACADYNGRSSLIQTFYINEGNEASVAHLLWKARMAREELLRTQDVRLGEISEHYVMGRLEDGSAGFEPRDIIQSSQYSSNYDGKKGGSDPAP